MKVMARFLVLALLASLAIPSLLLSQTATGGVRGVIRDESGAVIPGATVTITNKGTGITRQTISDETGNYEVTNLLPGTYEVKTELTSFQSQAQTLTVLTGANANADFKLKVGVATEVVQVTSDAAQVNLTDYKIDGVVTRDQIENLPLNGRNFLQLAMLEPGVEVVAVSNPGTSPNNFFRVSIAGASQALTRISVDGATVNDRVTGGSAQNFSQETVQEFQITTFNFDLATSVTGVGSVNVVSRTGSNDLHGSGFFFFRDHNLAAFPGLKRDPTNPDPFFARRQSGFYLGGPIKKDKIFWFTNFEYNNQTSVQTIAHSDPAFFAYDHIGQAPFRGKQFNTRFDYKLTAKHNAFFRYSQDNSKNLSSNGNLESNWIKTRNFAHQALLGVTSVLSRRIVNDFRYSYHFYSAHLTPPGAEDCTNALGCIGLGGPNIVIAGGGPTIGNNQQVPQKRLLRTYQMTDNMSWVKGTHRIRFGGEWEHFYGSGDWGLLSTGRFDLFGPSVVAVQSPTLYAALPATLRTTTSGTPTLADIQKLPFAVLTFGVGDIGQPPNYNGDNARHNNRLRGFVQDTWRLRPRFTLNFGLAYSYEDKLGNHDLDKPEYLRPILGGASANLNATRRDLNNFDPAMGFAWSIDKANKTVIRAGAGIYHDSNLFYSRLGERASIGPRGNGLALLDGSIVPNPYPGTGSSILNFTTPTYVTQKLVADIFPLIQSDILKLWGTGTDLSIRGVEVLKQVQILPIFQHDSTVPYTFHVTAGIQREIMRNMILTADFVMRRALHFGGYHDVFGVDENRYNRRKVLSTNDDGSVVNVRDPVIPLCVGLQALDPKAKCSTGQMNVYRSAANFRYAGLLMKLDKRFSSRYQFTTSYAFSRYTGFNGIIDLDNLNASYGYQGGDRTHRLTFSGIWDVPYYNGNLEFVRGLLNGWQLSTIHQMVSSPPLNATIGVDMTGNGISTLVLPGLGFNGFGRGIDANHLRILVDDYNAKYPTSVTGKRTPLSQVVPAIKLPDNFSNGDTFFSTDLRLSRIFRIRERTKITFMAEGFNIFNVANLSGYSGGLNSLAAAGQVQSLTYGQPTARFAQVFGTGGPRAFQFGFRLSF